MKRIYATTRIAAAEPVFAGHFPGHPILPGVFLLGFARAAVAAALARPVSIVRVQRQRFIAPVLPGTAVTVECVLTGGDDGSFKAACKWRLPDGTLAARGELVMS